MNSIISKTNQTERINVRGKTIFAITALTAISLDIKKNNFLFLYLMKRDNNGRFCKKGEESNEITISVPSIKRIVLWVSILLILLPWITIISRLNLIKKIESTFEALINGTGEENTENGKKGLFY